MGDIKKIAFVDFMPNYNPKEQHFWKILARHYDLELVEKEYADYVFFSVWGNEHWSVSDRCVKIFYTGENRTPDFNACDYAIGFEKMTFKDRFLWLPLFYLYDECQAMEQKHLDFDRDLLLSEKTGFCSITVSNTNRDPIYEKLYNALNSYKKVDSGGKWNNNIGGAVKDKMLFDTQHKFSIVCENWGNDGYITEKIAQAFAARTIPIYWGGYLQERDKLFNPKAFINVRTLGGVDEVLKMVKEIDSNDDLFCQIIAEPALLDDTVSLGAVMKKLEDFLLNIFEQPIESAQRRTRYAKYVIAPQMVEMLQSYYYKKYGFVQKLRYNIKRILK